MKKLMVVPTEAQETQATYFVRWKKYQPFPQRAPADNMSTEKIKSKLGKLYSPAYIPEGYSLKLSTIYLEDSVRLVYQKDKSFIEVCQSPRKAKLEVKPGYYKSVEVGGNQGYLISGNWLGILTEEMKEEDIIPLEWNPDWSQKLIFEMDELVMSVTNQQGPKGEKIGEEELLKVGESFRLE